MVDSDSEASDIADDIAANKRNKFKPGLAPIRSSRHVAAVSSSAALSTTIDLGGKRRMSISESQASAARVESRRKAQKRRNSVDQQQRQDSTGGGTGSGVEGVDSMELYGRRDGDMRLDPEQNVGRPAWGARAPRQLRNRG